MALSDVVKHTVKGAGVTALTVCAMHVAPELKEFIYSNIDKIDPCTIGEWGKETLRAITYISHIALPIATAGGSYWGSTKIWK